MFKKIEKTASTSYNDISRRVFGTPERAGDIEKLNNGIESGEVLVPQEDEETESSEDGLRLEIGDKVYKDFPEHMLIDSLGSVKGAVLIFNTADKDYDLNFGEGDKLYDENGLFLKGRIANILPNMDNRAKWVQVETKSKAGILLETDLPYPLEFVNLSLRQILTNIAGYYGVNIEFSDAPELDEIFKNEVGTSFAAQIDEKTFNFMFRLCQSKGLLLQDTGDGLFVGRLNTDVKEKINFIEGEATGIAQINSQFITDGLARYYEVNSQYPQTASATVQIPFPFPITKRFNSNDFNASDLPTIAARIACQEIGKAFKVNVVLNENKPLKSGNIAVVKSASAYIKEETDFVIESVIWRNNNTHVSLTLPCAYTGIIPETLPLCS